MSCRCKNYKVMEFNSFIKACNNCGFIFEEGGAMLTLGKRYDFANGDGNMIPTSSCLLICFAGCNSSASAMCSCSKRSQKTKSYQSHWNSLHRDWVAPDGG